MCRVLDSPRWTLVTCLLVFMVRGWQHCSGAVAPQQCCQPAPLCWVCGPHVCLWHCCRCCRRYSRRRCRRRRRCCCMGVQFASAALHRCCTPMRCGRLWRRPKWTVCSRDSSCGSSSVAGQPTYLLRPCLPLAWPVTPPGCQVEQQQFRSGSQWLMRTHLPCLPAPLTCAVSALPSSAWKSLSRRWSSRNTSFGGL